jgi:hypothetical protein
VVLRILRGEPLDALSRELGVEMYRLEQWRDRALFGMEDGLRVRDGDPLETAHQEALRRIGELSMENELLRVRCEKNRPLSWKRSGR